MKPNIVLINCDDLGYGDLGCYGSKVNKTPTIDKLADDGMKFTNFYMSSSVCSPSRASMLTGCYPKRIGFYNFEGWWVLFPGQRYGLNPEEKTIAKVLKEKGYNTMHIGKWHCGDQEPFLPTRHGFDHYYGLPFSNDMGRQVGVKEILPPLPLLKDEEVIQAQPDQSSLTERYVEKAVSFIRENKEHPFFLYLAHMHVHLPHYVPERFYQQSDNGEYGAAVETIDWATEVITHELQRLGLEENTLVIFTSDNGSRALDEGGSNLPLRGRKTTSWEGGFRVPCIMKWPNQIPKGKICDEMATSMDLYPTLTNLVGGKMPDKKIDGLDIKDLMFGKNKSIRNEFFYYCDEYLEAVRMGKWKLHIKKDGKAFKALYNLEEDIGEETNVYDEYPDIVEKLSKRIDLCIEDLGDGKILGSNCRAVGKVDKPKPLTTYDPNHPYIIAMYDKNQRG